MDVEDSVPLESFDLADSAEQRGVDEAVSRLTAEFPQVGHDEVARVVDEVHHEFDGRPVRDFVPVLVQKTAKRRLAARVDA